MSEQTRDAAIAGLMLVVTIALCAGIGLLAGLLLGAPAPPAIGGVFIRFAIGLRVVYTRFRDI